MSLCSICLRTNLTVNTVGNALISLYDNLLDHQIFPNLSLCATCKQLLERCYDFKQLCQKSNKTLQDWKKKKKPEISIDNLHSLIQPCYGKVLETNDEKQIKTASENLNDLTKDDNSILSNNSGTELVWNKDTVIEIDDDDDFDDVEKLENWEDLLQHNDILKQSMELSHLNLSTEPFEKTDLNLIDNEDNGIGNNSDNEHNRIEDNSDNEHNGIEDNSDNEHNGIEDKEWNGNESDNDDYDSNDDLEMINKLLEDAKTKTIEMTKKNQQLKEYIGVRKKKGKGGKPSSKRESYESVFDIVLFESYVEAKEDLLERPSTDYYRNATAKCTICYSVFRSQKSLDYHMRRHDPSTGDHVCDICEMRFKMRETLKAHRFNAHYARFSCKMCPLVTYHKSVMMAHTKLHQGILYKCKYCGATIRHHQSFLCHLRMYHPTILRQINHVCTICGRSFASPLGLKMHRNKMHQITEDVVTESSTKCEDCDLTFINQEAYTVHAVNAHKDTADLISRTSCAVCGKRFEDRQSLLKHKREHRLKTSYRRKYRGQERTEVTCKQCGATGENRKWLFNHCRRKHPEKSYEASYQAEHLCEQCGKGFRLRWQLTEHQRMHTGERPFACDECDRSFATKLKLTNHIARHKPPSKVCAVCGKKFVSASNLQNHMRIHIGDRRYKCSLCDKGFLHANALSVHVRGVHHHIRRVRKPRQQENQSDEE